MKRRLAVLIATVAVATAVGLYVPVSPASATEICGGEGTVHLNARLLYFDPADGSFFLGLAHATNTPFAFAFALGACVIDLNKQLVATGVVSGWCGLSSGFGVTNHGHSFAWVGVGGILVVTGHLDGIAQVMPNSFNPDDRSCLQPGVDDFIVNLVVTVGHCQSLTTSSTPGPFLQWTIFVSECQPAVLLS